MSGIVKICKAVNNKVDKVYAFIGERLIGQGDVDIDALYGLEPNNSLFDGVFTESEKQAIERDGTDVVFVNAQIHPDDTVETVKKKFLRAAKDKDLVYEGLYMFAKSAVELTTAGVYQTLTQDGSLELTPQRFVDFLLNIDDIDVSSLASMDGTVSYDQVLALDFESKRDWLVDKPIGQQFAALEKSFPYTVNPYNAVAYDSFLTKFSSDLLSTTNQSLLMESGELASNTLYMCSVIDVMEYAISVNLSEDTTIRVYFPYLHALGITSLSGYREKAPAMVVETDSMIEDQAWLRNVDNVNLFYDVTSSAKNENSIFEQGIKEATVSISPEYTYNLPLDVVFKLIHADEGHQFIKFNPGKRQEKIYRLYADRVAVNGKKIPALAKGTIFKAMKQVGRNKEVAVYMERETEYGTSTIVLSFLSGGMIAISFSLPKAMSIAEVDQLLRDNCNSVIDSVRDYVTQRGYGMKRFETIMADDVDVEDLVYTLRAPVRKAIKLTNMSKCLSSVFNVLESNVKDGAVMRFKRVADYSDMDGKEAYVVERLNKGAGDVEVITGLMENFQMKDLTAARTFLADFISKQQIVRAAFRSKRLRIKKNPGFLTTIVTERYEPNVVVTVSGINSKGYLRTIPVYIHALITITQDPDSTAVSSDVIAALCSKGVIANERVKDDLDAAAKEPGNNVQLNAFGVDAEPVEAPRPIAFGMQADDAPDAAAQQALLAMLVGDSDEDEDEDEEEDEDMGGGAKTPELEVDLTGMSMHPNPLHKRLVERQPQLILEKDEGNFKSYSRACPSNAKRQPAILTKEEKDRIDREHPGSYTQALEYTPFEDGPTYYYICPKYWSVKDGVSLTKEEVDSGKYGKLIPKGRKELLRGENVYHLDSSYHRDKDGNEIQLSPGFYSKKIPGTDLCVPCCYKEWDKPEQVRLRAECATPNARSKQDEMPGAEKPVDEEKLAAEVRDDDQAEEKPQAAEEPKVTAARRKKARKQATSKLDEYIKGPEKFPLEAGRLGYLPIGIQRFIGTENRACQISATNTNIKKDFPCIIRQGVEYSANQSFIAAIANIYSDTGGMKGVPSIAQMKEVLKSALTIDRYATLQNGSLVDIFDKGGDTDISKYSSSSLYTDLTLSDPEQLGVMKKIARSYENYLEYLSGSGEITYEHLWDLVCMPNPALFDKGINLVIMELRDEDITDNVHVLCPSNHYSSSFFDVNKRAAILLKVGGLYEPIITYEDKGSKYIINRRFSLKYKDVLPVLRSALETIKAALNDKCGPLPSRPRVYKFKTNISLERLVYLLKLRKYRIDRQLMNYSGKVVAVLATKDKWSGTVPCYPSAPIDGLSKYGWMDAGIGDTYEKTKEFLERVSIDSKKAIPCLPKIKVIDDGLIVGVLTQTNQFIPVTPTQDTYGNDLEVLRDLDYIQVNKDSLTSTAVDTEREAYVRRISLETNFFNAFRNTARLLLGKYSHLRVREEIEEITSNASTTYMSKLRRVDKLLRGLLSNKVAFADYADGALDDISAVAGCVTEDKAACETRGYCMTGDGDCRLLIPKTNLINGQGNEAMYYGRVADELVRYTRIRSFLLKPRAFLAFSEVKYDLREDEVILLQSLLTPAYFDDLIPRADNPYIAYNTYDTAEPYETQRYTDEVQAPKAKQQDALKCGTPSIGKVAGKWARMFPPESNELLFPTQPVRCSFDLMKTLLQLAHPEDAVLTRNDMIEALADEYASLYAEYPVAVLNTLKLEGKLIISKKIEMGQLSVYDAVMSEDYYLTTLDLWVAATRFKFPIVFYSPTKFAETDSSLIVATNSDDDAYFFVKVTAAKPGTVPKCKLLVAGGNVVKIPLMDLSADLREEIVAGKARSGLVNYLSGREDAPLKRPKAKPKRKLVVKKDA